MTESITSRVARLISGSVNNLIDAVENAAPETVMEAAIREIDGATDDVRRELGRVAAGKHLASGRLMDANRKHEDLAEKIALAVEEGRDDLAEVAIAQQMDIEVQIPVLEHAIGEASDQERELEGHVQALQARKREMQEELRRYRQSHESAAADDGAAPAKAPSRAIDEAVRRADSAFDRVLEKATGMPSRPGAPDRHTAAQVAELEALQRANRIKERLAAVKAANKGE